MRHVSKRWLFSLFFLSGFSALVCQVVWLRLAFAAFGVVTPVVSVLLSAFMLGLGLGSWLAGAIVKRWPWRWQVALRAYAGAEFVIGAGALVVPLLFVWGEQALLPAGEADSAQYLAYSALVMFIALLPFCLCMGLTFPFMLQVVRSDGGAPAGFSFLYVANVFGAMTGTLLAPFVFVELWGFRTTLAIAACANWIAAGVSVWLSTRQQTAAVGAPLAAAPPEPVRRTGTATPWSAALMLTVLFSTGLTSMAAEVVWMRAYSPMVNTQVYWFSGFLFAYLLSTAAGSWVYRWQLARGRALPSHSVLALLALAAFGQLLLADPRLTGARLSVQLAWIAAGICPYCAILGYLTPKVIDEYSTGNPTAAGRAYAVNVLGCIIGPLLASYVLIPYLGVQWSGMLLALPIWGLAGFTLRRTAFRKTDPTIAGGGLRFARAAWFLAAGCGVAVATVGKSRELKYASPQALVLRDHTATVIADELDGTKRLYVNGMSITVLQPPTKLMAHYPLCYVDNPQSALSICFGMGTTHRSCLSWDIESTAVELAPSVYRAFGYFFDDADEVRRNELGRMVVDDGRRYLRRTSRKFDLITLDPPPPVEAAGSSLLYSTEFYRLVKERLSERGLLHQWFPGGDQKVFQAALRSVVEEFPHVRLMRGIGRFECHILASERPIPRRTAEELAQRLPEKAQRDLVEWSADRTPESMFAEILASEFEPSELLDSDPRVMITDDRPYNEYCLLRRLREWWTNTHASMR
jgi:spermidine synthase